MFAWLLRNSRRNNDCIRACSDFMFVPATGSRRCNEPRNGETLYRGGSESRQEINGVNFRSHGQLRTGCSALAGHYDPGLVRHAGIVVVEAAVPALCGHLWPASKQVSPRVGRGTHSAGPEPTAYATRSPSR